MWEATSFQLERLQASEATVAEEQQGLASRWVTHILGGSGCKKAAWLYGWWEGSTGGCDSPA